MTTNDTVYTGLRASRRSTGAANRTAFMEAVLTHLGAPQQAGSSTRRRRGSRPPPCPPPPAPPPGDATGTPGADAPGVPGTGDTPAPSARRLNLLLRSQGLTKARRGGVLVTLGCSARCTVRLDLVVDGATQRRLGLTSRRIGRRTYTMTTGGRRALHVALTPRAKRRLRLARSSVRVSVQATWMGVSPAPRTSGTIRLRR